MVFFFMPNQCVFIVTLSYLSLTCNHTPSNACTKLTLQQSSNSPLLLEAIWPITHSNSLTFSTLLIPLTMHIPKTEQLFISVLPPAYAIPSCSLATK